MKRLFLVGLLLVSGFGFSQTKKPATGSELLVQLEAEFAADVARHGHDAFITHFAADGVEITDGGGFDTIEDMRKEAAWPEGMTLTWKPVKAEMAASGDLGYTYGNYVLTTKDKEGKFVAHHGKYMSVWRKEKDGQWKVTADMGNSSPDPKP